ncbi:MAG: expansin EXLX1 family cellulose-binding protein [Sandaracinaceae bacterium]
MSRVLLVLWVVATWGCVSAEPDDGGLRSDAGISRDDAAAGSPDAGEPLTCEAPEAHSGEGTYYDADGSGNCSFPASVEDLRVAAMNQADYAGSRACGACVDVEGPMGRVQVRIVDRCPECAPGDIDLSPSAFDMIAERSLGRVPIRWTYVPCEVEGPLVYHFKDGSNPFWTAVQVRNHRHRIARFEYRNADGAFVEAERAEYNFFVEPAGMGEGPFTFRVTDIYGDTVTDTGIPLRDDDSEAGAGQFPECE